jgi:hypothetical protein
MGIRVRAAIEERTALKGMAPNSVTEILANMNEEPQMAASITRVRI